MEKTQKSPTPADLQQYAETLITLAKLDAVKTGYGLDAVKEKTQELIRIRLEKAIAEEKPKEEEK